MSIEAKKDWRVGLACTPKLQTHRLYGTRGVIVDVLPNGTAGLVDKDGVLAISVPPEILLAKADEWKTA